jgi:hypothetical protein
MADLLADGLVDRERGKRVVLIMPFSGSGLGMIVPAEIQFSFLL